MSGSARQLYIAVVLLAGLPVLSLQAQTSSQNFSPEAIRFFQDEVQPLLENNCRACHNDKTPSSGLSVESRVALLTGGNRGPALLPGRPQESLLLEALSHQGSRSRCRQPASSPRRQSRLSPIGLIWVHPGARADRLMSPEHPQNIGLFSRSSAVLSRRSGVRILSETESIASSWLVSKRKDSSLLPRPTEPH